MNWDEWIAENRRALEMDGTPFERLFVDEVLRKVPNLSPSCVSAQTTFDDLGGGTRRIDFTIEEGDYVRIALEVDGWDKTGTGSGMSRHEFHDWSYKELSITAAGWVPLRFANGLIKRKPEDLRESIELQLKMQREVEAAIKAGGAKAKAAEDEKKQLEAAAQAARQGERGAEASLRKLQSQRLETESAYLSEADSNRLHKLQGDIDRLNDELLKERGLREQAEEENRGMKVMGIAIAAVAILGIAAILLLRESDSDSGSPISSNDFEVSARCDDATPVGELDAADEGKLVTAKGEVAGARRIDDDNPRIYLNLGDDFPNQDLTIVIWGDDEKNWATPPESKYDNREVAVAGRLDTFDGSLQVAANSPNDIVICA